MHLKDKKDRLMCQVCNYGYAPLSQIFSYPGSRKLWFYCPAMFKIKCQVALLLIWICSVGSGTSIIRVITPPKISFWHYSYFREVDVLPTSSNFDHRRGWRGGGGGGWRGKHRTFLSYGQIFSWRVQPRTGRYIPVMQKWKKKTRVYV